MPAKNISGKTPKTPRKSRATRARPNRIYELTQARGWTYAEVAEKIRHIAELRGDAKRANVHELTINRLATGVITLNAEWMALLGEVYGVPAVDVIATPTHGNMRLLKVTVALQGNQWRASHTLQPDEQIEIMVPDDVKLRGVSLYAAEIRGNIANLRYSDRSIVILSKLPAQHEIVEGRRYHVRLTRSADGLSEETVRLMVSRQGTFWLKAETDDPTQVVWVPLDGTPECKVELLGRVRGVYFRED